MISLSACGLSGSVATREIPQNRRPPGATGGLSRLYSH